MNAETTKNVLLFVHIPKTAGTSFRKSLERLDNVAMFYDYGENSPETSRELIEGSTNEGKISDQAIFHDDKIDVICGHIRFQKYSKFVDTPNAMAILRNPIERIVSEYQHLVRHGNLRIPFSEFVATPKQINKQSKMLKGIKINEGGIWGLTSHYEYFLRLVERRFGLAIVPSKLNTAPVSDHELRFNIPIEEIKSAFELNQQDLKLFFNVAKRFRAALLHSGLSLAPGERPKFNCRIEPGRRIVGWVARREDECLFVELAVNGERRAIVALDQLREDVASQGLSECAMCGFSYPLSLLGATSGDEVRMRVLGMAGVAKSLIVPNTPEIKHG